MLGYVHTCVSVCVCAFVGVRAWCLYVCGWVCTRVCVCVYAYACMYAGIAQEEVMAACCSIGCMCRAPPLFTLFSRARSLSLSLPLFLSLLSVDIALCAFV